MAGKEGASRAIAAGTAFEKQIDPERGVSEHELSGA
jgi:hypothetical protein